MYAREPEFEEVSQWIATRLRYLNTDGPDLSQQAGSTVQDLVEAQFSNGEWYGARVTQRHSDGTIDVLFDDGVAMEHFEPHQVRNKAAAETWGAEEAKPPMQPLAWGAEDAIQPLASHRSNRSTRSNSLTLLKAKQKSSTDNRARRRRGSESSFGAAPTVPAAAPAMDYRGYLEAFYRDHHPDKVANVGRLLKSYSGREASLIETIEQKYGLNPGYIMLSLSG